jgi:uncharacterized membrane protein YkoI
MVVAGLVAVTPALAQQTGASETPAVTMEAARKVALARVPGGKLQHEALEREHGRQVYSFEVVAPGKTEAEEVLVDAGNGKVVSVSPEQDGDDDRNGEDHGKDHDREEHSSGR